MSAAFAAGQIAGPVASSLLLHLTVVGANGLNIALQAAAGLLLLSAVWLWREGKSSTHHLEVSHVR